MKSVIKTASALLLVTTFAACTHYTLPEDPVEDRVTGQQAAAPQQPSPVMPVSQTSAAGLPPAQAMPASANAIKEMDIKDQPKVAPAKPAEPTMTHNGECTGGQHYINNGGTPVPQVKVRATGYGAPPKSFYSEPQRRLMAMRAAKVDAYRSLAERINGVQIWGGTTLGDMVVEKDRFRVYLDTHLRGARVIAENPLEDGSFETIVEVSVGQNMLNLALPAKNDCNEPSAPRQQAQQTDYIFSSASLMTPHVDGEPLANSNYYYQGN